MTTPAEQAGPSSWAAHEIRAGRHAWSGGEPPGDPQLHRKEVEPWLSALLQAEHVSLLVGSGLTTAIALQVGAGALDMGSVPFEGDLADAVNTFARRSAERAGRGEPNIEDQIRAARDLINGLRILELAATDRAAQWLNEWESALDETLRGFMKKVLDTERGIHNGLVQATERTERARRLLGSFLLTFASRAASRERLHIFTTNYDRVIEYGCDLLGLRVLDRFVGRLAPVFRSSRLGIDLHYNPPGIRGEPRYLEGVVRLTKLHGSIDWRQEDASSGRAEIQQFGMPFGAEGSHPGLPTSPKDSLLIYPNPAKDVETLDYPYADLFRDFAAAICQPNVVMVTYGYGFGDDHLNRILRDMLTIPSTHLVIISYDQAGGRIERFCDVVGRDEQITLLIGSHFGNLATLVDHYLPKPAIDRTTWRMVDLINRRTPSRREPQAGEAEPGQEVPG